MGIESMQYNVLSFTTMLVEPNVNGLLGTFGLVRWLPPLSFLWVAGPLTTCAALTYPKRIGLLICGCPVVIHLPIS